MNTNRTAMEADLQNAIAASLRRAGFTQADPGVQAGFSINVADPDSNRAVVICNYVDQDGDPDDGATGTCMAHAYLGLLAIAGFDAVEYNPATGITDRTDFYAVLIEGDAISRVCDGNDGRCGRPVEFVLYTPSPYFHGGRSPADVDAYVCGGCLPVAVRDCMGGEDPIAVEEYHPEVA